MQAQHAFDVSPFNSKKATPPQALQKALQQIRIEQWHCHLPPLP